MRILFVAMPQSVHTARWINQLAGRGWDIHLFPSMLEPLHEDLRDVTAYGVSARRPATAHRSVRWRGLWPLRAGSSIIGHQAQPLLPRALAALVRHLRPDLVHSLEMQKAGYLTLAAKEHLGGRFPPWAVTNWGSDIYVYGRLAAHRERIRAVLAACDYYGCECRRDVELGRAFGFTGTTLPLVPVAGGLRLDQIQRLRRPEPTSSRRLVLLKGYSGWAGRGKVGLRAIELCAPYLKGYRVGVYLASPEVALAAELVADATGIPIEIIPHGSHEDILRLHGRARVSIGLSIGDGISTSGLEAMSMGSFPIQSRTSCIDEWICDGETGALVHPDDPEDTAAALRRAVTDDRLVDDAAAANAAVTAQRLEYRLIQAEVVAAYEWIGVR
jgi:glycosyltransferase involved in cell wall biosynthesis